MEITVRTQALARELHFLQGIAARKGSIPALSHVLLEAEGASVHLAATDLDISLRGWCHAEVKQAGAITLPARKLYEIIRSLPDADVRMAVVKDSWVEIRCEQALFRVAGLPKDEFPVLPEVGADGVEIPAISLRLLIERTGFAVPPHEGHYDVAGALLVLEDNAVSMVATDGHRMAYDTHPLDLSGRESTRVGVPKRAIKGLARLLDDDASHHEYSGMVMFRQVRNHLAFCVAHRTLTVNTVEGQFPAYEKVMGAAYGTSVSVNRADLATAIRRVNLLSSSNAIRVMLAQGAIVLTAAAPDLGEAREDVSVEYSGDVVENGFNARYLLDFLAAAKSDKVKIELKDAPSAGLLYLDEAQGSGYRYVVMPMRL